jgi:hypothetical protein
MTEKRRRPRKATTGTTTTATESSLRALPQNTAPAPSQVFDASDVALLFLTIVAITLSIVLPQLGKDPRDPTTLVFDDSSQVTNNFVNAAAETALPMGIVITLVVTLILVFGFIVYLVWTKKLSEVKRLAPFLAIASFFVAAGSLIRLYPSDWSNTAADVFVLVGCGLALSLVVMDFKILSWGRKIEEDELKKQAEETHRNTGLPYLPLLMERLAKRTITEKELELLESVIEQEGKDQFKSRTGNDAARRQV